jgi:hypothetical protein
MVAVVGWAKTKPVRHARFLRRQVKNARTTGTGSASGTRPFGVERTWRPCKTRVCPGCGRRSVNLAPAQAGALPVPGLPSDLRAQYLASVNRTRQALLARGAAASGLEVLGG